MQLLPGLVLLLLPFVSVSAQTITTTDDTGQTIVEVITTDALGLPTTSIVETITPAAAAPTTTTVDAGGGTSYVEVISVDADGDTVTDTISTILPGAGAATATTTTVDAGGGTSYVEVIQNGATQTIQTITPDANAGGPVGQPATGGSAGVPTPFTYTTTDGNGQTIAVLATFTPSIATTRPVSLTFSATVLDYSQYIQSYATAVPTQNTADTGSASRCRPWMLSALVGVLSGLGVLLRL
ncbi:Protein kinase domain-containing protein [Mycena kentingensis (nom. inval.)]|nr:Protein kinase domain-containing protein [Mycena kentingensis (nom. inval.)]